VITLLSAAASADTPMRYGCDRPIELAFYEFGPLYHDGSGIDRDVVDEIIALGPSNLGPLLRVFLGSNAANIARHANIVCLILPRRGA
jgi:hypothetical protein